MSSESQLQRFSPPPDEPLLARGARRASGVYYTPPEIVRWMVGRSLEVLQGKSSLSRGLRVLDPACGAGAFLREVRERVPSGTLVGVDVDASAIAAARESLKTGPQPQLICVDFLAESFCPEPLDLILGNPPYVNIRELAKSTSPEYRLGLRQRFQAARGNFDLYVLFLERSLELLRPGGVCGMIIPNKWSGLDYARPLRELLLAETTICDLVDLSGISVFAAAEVYPQILIFQKQRPARTHAIRVREVASPADLEDDSQPVRLLPQRLLSPATIVLSRTLDVESRVPTQPLGQRARLHSGASGYTAGHMAELLEEEADVRPDDLSRDLRPFIVSGNIDRYRIESGRVRYMQRQFHRPVLDLNSESLSPLKKRLYAQPKIVIAGMSRRIEAAYDDQGLALGVQVYAAAEPLDDPYHLLALLNSRLMSFLFRERFPAKKLSGGYLAMNKGQLQQLPIWVPGEGGDGIADRLSQLARMRCAESGQARSLPYELDRQIDDLVYELYRLSAAEIRQVDAAFEERGLRAA